MPESRQLQRRRPQQQTPKAVRHWSCRPAAPDRGLCYGTRRQEPAAPSQEQNYPGAAPLQDWAWPARTRTQYTVRGGGGGAPQQAAQACNRCMSHMPPQTHLDVHNYAAYEHDICSRERSVCGVGQGAPLATALDCPKVGPQHLQPAGRGALRLIHMYIFSTRIHPRPCRYKQNTLGKQNFSLASAPFSKPEFPAPATRVQLQTHLNYFNNYLRHLVLRCRARKCDFLRAMKLS